MLKRILLIFAWVLGGVLIPFSLIQWVLTGKSITIYLWDWFDNEIDK